MIHRLPIIILVVAVLATVFMLADRPVVREAAHVSHGPAVAIAAPASGTMHDVATDAAPTSAKSAVEDESIPLHKRRAYRPRRSPVVVVASAPPSSWVCVPGTGVALWPKSGSSS